MDPKCMCCGTVAKLYQLFKCEECGELSCCRCNEETCDACLNCCTCDEEKLVKSVCILDEFKQEQYETGKYNFDGPIGKHYQEFVDYWWPRI